MGNMTLDARAKREWRTHWPVVLASMAGTMLSIMHFYTIGLFMKPLEQEFGWSRSEVSSGLIIVSVVAVLLSPFVGALIDRWGARLFGILGVLIYCTAIATLSLANGSLWAWWAAWLVLAAGSLCLKPTVFAAAIASKFVSGRGLALAIVLCGTGIGSALFPPITTYLLQTFGWRTAYVALALIGLVIVLPLILRFFFDATTDIRRNVSSSTPQGPALTGMRAREGLLSRRFFQLALSAFLMTFSLTALVIHFVPIVTIAGLPRTDAAAIASAIGIASLIGRVGSGFLLDKMSGVLIASTTFGLPIVAVLTLLWFDGSVFYAIAIAITVGLCLGAEIDIVAYLATRYFGLRNFGLIFGSIVGLLSFSTGTGSFVASLSYDLTGSYAPFFWLLLPMLVISVLLVATLGPYPVFESGNGADSNAQPTPLPQDRIGQVAPAK